MRLVADLERLLRLRAIPFGVKLFESREEMEAIPRIRRPKWCTPSIRSSPRPPVSAGPSG
jgi:hypothetical protein